MNDYLRRDLLLRTICLAEEARTLAKGFTGDGSASGAYACGIILGREVQRGSCATGAVYRTASQGAGLHLGEVAITAQGVGPKAHLAVEETVEWGPLTTHLPPLTTHL